MAIARIKRAVQQTKSAQKTIAIKKTPAKKNY